MCGIIGFCSDCTTTQQLQVLKKVMVESRIRGKHASGIAWWDDTLHVRRGDIPIDQLVKEVNWDRLVNKNIKIIAHARYSTSNLEYNQPLFDGGTAIVHNGVITQSDSSQWYDKFHLNCCTKNDSELLLRAYMKGENFANKFKNSSIASIILDKGKFIVYRNGLRPLWVGTFDNATIYASTFDILQRSGVENIHKVDCCNSQELQYRTKENTNDR